MNDSDVRGCFQSYAISHSVCACGKSRMLLTPLIELASFLICFESAKSTVEWLIFLINN